MSRLGITRTAEQLTDLTETAASKGIEIIPLPLVVTQAIKFELTDQLKNNPDWILFTSANGVVCFLKRLEELNFSLPPTTKFGVVGKKTMRALDRFGYKPTLVASDTYGQILFDEFMNQVDNDQLVLYARAEEVILDPRELLEENGYIFSDVICYRSIPNQLDNDLITQFEPDDSILFTAPSSVRSYSEQFEHPKSKLIAIGTTTAQAMEDAGWDNITIMKIADVDKVLEYI